MRKNLLIRMLVGFLLLLSTEYAQEYSDDEQEYKYKEKECDSDTNDFNEEIVKQKIEACYQILGLEEGVDQKEISKTFRKRAQTCHPDKYPGNEQKNEDFKKLNNNNRADHSCSLLAWCSVAVLLSGSWSSRVELQVLLPRLRPGELGLSRSYHTHDG